ncbi:MAG: FKBP-type peptidyl-prolyl cis-trans isomerase [Stellaceae bacterium]
MMKAIGIAGAAMMLALGLLTTPAAWAQGMTGTMTEMPDGLKYTDTQIGTGRIAEPGHSVTVQYTGWLYENGVKGKKFDSSLDHGGGGFTFKLGAHQVIRGWDKGVPGMKIGGERTLIIPAHLAYGERGAGGVIPPFATLMFEVKLLKVE